MDENPFADLIHDPNKVPIMVYADASYQPKRFTDRVGLGWVVLSPSRPEDDPTGIHPLGDKARVNHLVKQFEDGYRSIYYGELYAVLDAVRSINPSVVRPLRIHTDNEQLFLVLDMLFKNKKPKSRSKAILKQYEVTEGLIQPIRNFAMNGVSFGLLQRNANQYIRTADRYARKALAEHNGNMNTPDYNKCLWCDDEFVGLDESQSYSIVNKPCPVCCEEKGEHYLLPPVIMVAKPGADYA